MVRIQVISDVHMEFQADAGRGFISHLDPKDVDVLVVAGDLCSRSMIENTLLALSCLYRNVIYVLGNHESYGSTIQESREAAQTAACNMGNLHFLDNSTCTIDGQRFVGTTLWFRNDPNNVFHESSLNDFYQIRGLRDVVYEENARAVKFLTETVQSDDVVVTHHLPSFACVSDRFRNSSINRFFVCGMDNLIFDRDPKLWIHGHTHDSKDFMHGETRIVCNPFGYAGVELNPEYAEQKVVEI